MGKYMNRSMHVSIYIYTLTGLLYIYTLIYIYIYTHIYIYRYTNTSQFGNVSSQTRVLHSCSMICSREILTSTASLGSFRNSCSERCQDHTALLWPSGGRITGAHQHKAVAKNPSKARSRIGLLGLSLYKVLLSQLCGFYERTVVLPELCTKVGQ